jgi:hypothetical protein
VLAVLMLGPALGRGFVLSYDMVWVPDLAMRPDFLGLGSGLPRAVPSDAVLSVLDELVPAMLLQKAVLVGALVAAGLGAARLAPPESLTGRLVAVTVVEWSPFVAERTLIGHWPLLLGFAALPWLVVVARQVRAEHRVPPSVCWLMLLGSLSAGAGLVSAIVLLAFASTRDVRRTGALVAVVVAANAPWLVAGLLHASTATSDRTGALVFALHDEGSVPGPLAAITLGGIWNADVVPGSRTGWAGWLVLVMTAALAAAGVRGWVATAERREVLASAGCWCAGWGLAVLTWAAPGVVGGVVEQVPGGGLLRDGARALALCLPALAATVARGAAEVSGWLPGGVSAAATGVALVLLPVALMPDAAGGMSGRLRAVSYPASFASTRHAVERVESRGDLVLLPFSSYRAPPWNHRHPVLDPLGRYLPGDFVASDRLLVSGRLVEGEDPRGVTVRRALGAPTPALRARLLARAGIGVVVAEQDTGQPVPEVYGVPLTAPDRTGWPQVVQLDDPAEESAPASWWWATSAAWLAFLALVATAVGRTATRWYSAARPGKKQGEG